MMKKSLAILALSMALSAGSVMVSMADAGWTTENGKWVYHDSNGDLVTDEWKKGADNLWRYLNVRGEMAVDTWVDDCYYVDANGIMASGKWLHLSHNFMGETDEAEWYYFNDNGKVVSDGWKKINNRWYHFDSDGVMETGWIENDMYYAGEDGAALVGWHMLYPPEGQEDESNPFDENEGKKWYYFNSSGKKYVPSDNAVNGYAEKRIDGIYYCFDVNGAMQTGWVNVGTEDGLTDSIEGYRLYGKDGKGVTGWYTAEPPAELSSGYENEVDWFYFSRSGVPKVGPMEGDARVNDFVRINNKTYLFNDMGTPVWGLQRVYTDSSQEEYTAYCFEEGSRTALKGKQMVVEGDGSVGTFFFTESGKGYTGVKNNSLYYMGKLQFAEDGLRYEPIHIPGGSTYLVNEAGRIVKSTSGVKDENGVKYVTNSGGVLQKVDGEYVGGDEYGREAIEPIWNY